MNLQESGSGQIDSPHVAKSHRLRAETETALRLFEKPSSCLAPEYPYVTNRHYRKCKRAAKALNFLA